MASAVPNRERNGALAPGDGKTCTPCSSGQHPEFIATTKTSQGRALLQSERNATLMHAASQWRAARHCSDHARDSRYPATQGNDGARSASDGGRDEGLIPVFNLKLETKNSKLSS